MSKPETRQGGLTQKGVSTSPVVQIALTPWISPLCLQDAVEPAAEVGEEWKENRDGPGQKLDCFHR